MSSEHWTDEENDLIVADYFAMLADDVFGRPYSKAEHRRTDLPPLKWSSEYHRLAIQKEAGDAQETAFDRRDHRQAA